MARKVLKRDLESRVVIAPSSTVRTLVTVYTAGDKEYKLSFSGAARDAQEEGMQMDAITAMAETFGLDVTGIHFAVEGV